MPQLFLGSPSDGLGGPLLDGLNADQRAAVSHTRGPVLVIAAPGSGKTLVLTRRIAHLIHQGVPPDQILAVTFTRKAAQEMAERLLALLKDKYLVQKVTLCTFNSLGGKLLEGRHEKVGFSAKPHLLLETTQRTLFDVLRRDADAETVRADELAQFISSAKSRLLGPDEVKRVSSDEAEVQMARLYRAYEGRLKRQNLYDFDDQILLPIRLMQQDPVSRAELQARFSHVLVDEFQDTNRAQYTLTRLLASPQNNLFAVGDDAQGIYGFRAADLDNLLCFERDYADCQRIVMETNYRSTPPIVALANNLIRHNSRQIAKTIRAHAKGGADVPITQAQDSFEEAKGVASRIVELAAGGTPLEEIAVLYRTHAQSGLIIEALSEAKIPYSAKKSGHFYENPAIQELLAYLRLAMPRVQPLADLGLEQLLKRFGVEGTSLAILRAEAERSKSTLVEAAQKADSLPLPTLMQRAAVRHVMSLIASWRVDRRPVAALILKILDDTRLRKTLEKKRGEEARVRLDVLSTFHEQVRRWQATGVGDVLRRVEETLKPDRKARSKKAVQLMTIHASKGLEWDAVFVLGLEEGTLPYQMAIEEGGISEERRLCYVAITRARKYLQVSFSREKVRFGHRKDAIPSRFVREMREGPPTQGNSGPGAIPR